MSRLFDVRARASFAEPGRPQVVITDRWRNLALTGRRVVKVPTGETVAVALGVSPSKFAFLKLASNVEGVTWVPVRTAGNTGTRGSLDWLSDLPTTIPTVSRPGNFLHDHGAKSYNAPVDHSAVGTRLFYQALPTYLSFKDDADDPHLGADFYADLRLASVWADDTEFPDDRVPPNLGRVVNDIASMGGLFLGKKNRILLGMERYADMDVDAPGDEVLAVKFEGFVSGATDVMNVTVRLVCYPFTGSDLIGPLPGSLTDQGDVVWGPEDVYLCPSAAPGGSTLATYYEATKTIPLLNNDQQQTTLSFLKSDFVVTGDATLKRVTMIDLDMASDDETVITACIPGTLFGPVRTIAAEELRPFAFRPGTFWTGADAPTISLVNASGRDAEVIVEWGEEP